MELGGLGGLGGLVTKGVEMASVAKDGTTWSSWEDQSWFRGPQLQLEGP